MTKNMLEGSAARIRRHQPNTAPYPNGGDRVTAGLTKKAARQKTPREQLALARRASERMVPEKQAITLELPWPPTANNLFKNTSSGRVLTAKAKRYRTDAGHLINLQNGVAFPVRPPLALRVMAHPPADKRRRDIDNLLKAPIDAMQAMGLFVDDADIDYVLIQRENKSTHGLLRIRLWTLDR